MSYIHAQVKRCEIYKHVVLIRDLCNIIIQYAISHNDLLEEYLMTYNLMVLKSCTLRLNPISNKCYFLVFEKKTLFMYCEFEYEIIKINYWKRKAHFY